MGNASTREEETGRSKSKIIPTTKIASTCICQRGGVGERPSAGQANGKLPCLPSKQQLQKPTSKANVSCRSAVFRTEAELGVDLDRSCSCSNVGQSVRPQLEEASTRALSGSRTSRKHPPPGHPPRQADGRPDCARWTVGTGPRLRRGRAQMGRAPGAAADGCEAGPGCATKAKGRCL